MADYLSVVYGENVRPYTDYPSKLVSYLFEKFDMKVGMKILEPGCGRGEFLSLFGKLGMDAYGLDRSEEGRASLLKNNIELTVCDVESDEGLPFADNSFDVILFTVGFTDGVFSNCELCFLLSFAFVFCIK